MWIRTNRIGDPPSFSTSSVGEYLNRKYNSTQDFIITRVRAIPSAQRFRVTADRLLSILIAEPGETVATTEKLVPWDSWQDAMKKHDKAGPIPSGIRGAWRLTDLPRASDIYSRGISRNGHS